MICEDNKEMDLSQFDNLMDGIESLESTDSENVVLEDPRISDLIKECVTIRYIFDNTNIKKESKKDICIDFTKLLNIKDPLMKSQADELSRMNVTRRKGISGKKFYLYYKDLQVILSYMTEVEFFALLKFRTICNEWHRYQNKRTKGVAKKIDSILDESLVTLAKFVNNFMQYISPEAYTPRLKNSGDPTLQELYFTQEQLVYMTKIIILAKITLAMTDSIDKNCRVEAKRYIADKIWRFVFSEDDKSIDVVNKIRKFIASRFSSTEFNEKRFWNAAKLANISIVCEENKLFDTFKSDSILMFEIDRNSLSFFDVFLKKTISFLSRKKFNLEYVLTNFDIQDSNMFKDITTTNKYSLLEDALMRKTVDNFINTEVMKYVDSKSAIEKFSETFNKNLLHFWIVVPFISKILNINASYITTIEKDKFLLLTLYVHHKLIGIKCYIMADLLKAKMKEFTTGVYNDNIKINSNVIAKYMKSERLQKFVEDGNFSVEDDEVVRLIINPLIAMLMNKYYSEDGTQILFAQTDLIEEYEKYLTYYNKLS